MDSSINSNLPKWLTKEVVERLKADIEACPNPYTKEEVLNLPYDEGCDMLRLNAYEALDTLTRYGLI